MFRWGHNIQTYGTNDAIVTTFWLLVQVLVHLPHQARLAKVVLGNFTIDS
jgi:hypothetical protein